MLRGHDPLHHLCAYVRAQQALTMHLRELACRLTSVANISLSRIGMLVRPERFERPTLRFVV